MQVLAPARSIPETSSSQCPTVPKWNVSTARCFVWCLKLQKDSFETTKSQAARECQKAPHCTRKKQSKTSSTLQLQTNLHCTQQQMMGSVHWTIAWQWVWPLIRKNLPFLKSHLIWLRPLLSMASSYTLRSRKHPDREYLVLEGIQFQCRRYPTLPHHYRDKQSFFKVLVIQNIDSCIPSKSIQEIQHC